MNVVILCSENGAPNDSLPSGGGAASASRAPAYGQTPTAVQTSTVACIVATVTAVGPAVPASQ